MKAEEMFESMGFKKEKFDYFGLDRFVYKKPIVDEGDYLYTVVVLFDKEELLKALIYDRGQYDKGYEDAMNEVKHPQPLKFEDLAPGMWVWDNFFTTFTRVENTYLYPDDALAKGTKMITFYCDTGVLTRVFKENRYYPVQIPWEGDKKQWERTIESYKQ